MISFTQKKFSSRKGIAFFFFCLFYLQTVGSVYAYANSTIFRHSPTLLSYEATSRNYEGLGTLKTLFGAQDVLSQPTQNAVSFHQVINQSRQVVLAASDQRIEDNGPGPTQPEMQSFKSVGADNMVDLFTGDFSYNIPLLDIGGYPVGIHYNSGITMDQEASWVGLGWNINPGTISRNVRGLPDDFNGTDVIEKTQNIKPNKTIGGSVAKSFELFGKPGAAFTGALGMSAGMFYNNYKGWGMEFGVSPSVSLSIFGKGNLTAGLSVGNNTQTGLDVSPSMGVSLGIKQFGNVGLGMNIGSNYNSRTGVQALQMGLSAEKNTETLGLQSAGFSFPVASMTFAKPSFIPAMQMPYTSESFHFSLRPGKYKNGTLTSIGTFSGYSSSQYIAIEDRTQRAPAYGYLYYQNAAGAGDNVLLDFNRDKEVPFRPNTPHIGVPSYTYDTYSISGEGIGGSFRPYRGDIGFISDRQTKTKSKSANLGLDVGIGFYAQIGVDLDKTTNQTTTGSWKTGSNILAKEIGFRKEDNSMSEIVYFKNPGEKVRVDSNYLEAVGDTDLVNFNLVGISSANTADPVLSRSLNRYRNQQLTSQRTITTDTYRKEREKRTQSISYLTAELAAKYALDTLIKIYDLNAVPSLGCNTNYYTMNRQDAVRKAHHLSEITVLNNEGKRYVYGIPAYNTLQEEHSFAVNKDSADLQVGLVGYTSIDDSVDNSVPNTDRFFSREKTPAFAHSFLLSSLLSADYVDVTGNGVSEDDQGDAIKFNYSRVYGPNTGYYRWRAPFLQNKASYGEGLKSDKRDDRGTYTYGEKELWYLNSVESKNMIAVFVVEKDSSKVRKDLFGVLGNAGGRDGAQKQYQLKEIRLYTKADLIKNGATVAKPIKTVHFEYDYSLCKNHPGSVTTSTGKLTLRKIWFSYNGNNKGPENPYQFKYDKDAVDGSGNVTGNNGPQYNNKSYDSWGNYKDPVVNPGGAGNQFTNAEYPYPTQDTAAANANAAAWALNEIKLPSGAKIKVTYESDDYGYVQNKRAMQMMELAGFGATSTDAPQASLYQNSVPLAAFTAKCNYVFIKVPEAVTDTAELRRKYLDGVQKMLVKFSMKVREDNWGGGYEMVPCYFDIDSYGIKGDPSDKIIWIKPKTIDNRSPFLIAATQFLRMNLYSKAYPGSEPGDDITIKSYLAALGSVYANIRNAIAGFYTYTLTATPARCKDVDLQRSFARLNNPYFKKVGGGHRVRRVEIYDNWNKMTANAQRESVYGQEYDYTTKVKLDNGSDKVISSGVATYETMVGRDENPFTIPSDPYKEEIGMWAPTNYFYTDEPVMESFYPAGAVGYSKVRISSISKGRKSGSGYKETEFFTSKDFPTRSNYTTLVEGESKYSYQNPKPKNLSFFNFNAKSYVSLSQGFKVELNDMNGKVKQTAVYPENGTNKVSYTINYYRMEKDGNGQILSNKVSMIDSADGVVNDSREMGKEVELMVDLRQQLSVTNSTSKQLNLLIQKISAPPGFFPIPIPLVYHKSEINRYRSAAVTKVVQRYGILDSVVVVEKGSKVSTKNLVYDSETGEPLLTRTNNEFDDPIYNFSYPAHWAYSGVQGAYKNIQKKITEQKITNGVLYDRSKEVLFESGDEIVLQEKEPNKKISNLIFTQSYKLTSRKVWAIDASKGLEKNKGIYFIDANGNAVTTQDNFLTSMTIIRSGKRNILTAGVGSITSMANPIRLVSSKYRLVFDSATNVINAGAGRYKDFWTVDSTVSPVDSCYKVLAYGVDTIPVKRALLLKKANDNTVITPHISVLMPTNLAAQMHHIQRSGRPKQMNTLEMRTIVDFDFNRIPLGATVTSAKMRLAAMPLRDTTAGMPSPGTGIYNNGADAAGGNNTKAHYNFGSVAGNNSVDLTRVTSNWTANTKYDDLFSLPVNHASSINLPSTVDNSCDNIAAKEINTLVQEIIDNRNNSFGILVGMRDYSVNSGERQTEKRSRSYYSGNTVPANGDCNPSLTIAAPYVAVAYEYMKDTCVLVCKPSIRAEGINPYKFGVLGNWRMDRAYSYYDDRTEKNPSVATNIRKDGTIKNFLPYWSFDSKGLSAASMDTNRWVWNSEMILYNRKGTEIENGDPLGRRNSGLYGYNKNLPIAVTQNSKSRNMAFDGFEDYDYKTSYCEAECASYNCLPPTYDAKLNRLDSLQNTMNQFLTEFNVPVPAIVRDSSGCDISTWGFGNSNVGPGKRYSVASVYFDGKVGVPDSSAGEQIMIGYGRNFCNTTSSGTYEINFKLWELASPPTLIFLIYFEKNGVTYLHDVRVGQRWVNGAVTQSGVGTVSRPDLKYDFRNKYNTLKLHFGQDTLSFYVNDTLLGKVGSLVTGATLKKVFPTTQFNRCTAKTDWIRYTDDFGRVMLDEQFNNCSDHALPKPDFNCQSKPDCSMAFTNYFNNKFKTTFSYAQIGTLYKQQGIHISPCGDSLQSCTNYDTVITRTAAYDRFADFTKGGGARSTIERHSGSYSLKVNANKNSVSIFKVASAAADSLPSAVSIKVDTLSSTLNYQVVAKGKGLLTRYNVFFARKALPLINSLPNTCMNQNINSNSPQWNVNTEYSNIDKGWGDGSPMQFLPDQYCASDYFGLEWTGKLQADFDKKYVFRLQKGDKDAALLYVDGSPVVFRFAAGEWKTDSISLQACRLYNIKLVYTHNTGSAKCSLLWSNPLAPEPTVIPLRNFYKPDMISSDTTGSCIPSPTIVKLNPVKPQNIHNPFFSPIAGTKLIVSVWVKEEQACYTGSYANCGIDVNFGNTTDFYKLRPAGNIIEGWQRIEGVVTVPANATSINIGMRSLGNTAVYFDDIRMHPFNSNMKSFVYNPANLRLMAELDENNHASFYEYDDDGTLIRVKKETIKGIKTVQETRSALWKE